MGKFTVTILPEKVSIEVDNGTSLLTAARLAGVFMESPCGGNGTCGKCAVRVIDGNVPDGAAAHLPEELRASGHVAACRIEVEEDLAVEIPAFSRMTRHKVLLSDSRKGAASWEKYVSGAGLEPVCRKAAVKLEKPELGDAINDFDRLNTALSRDHGIKNPGITLKCLKMLPEALRKGNWEITVTIAYIEGKPQIIALEPGIAEKPSYGLAVDIGTTTVVVNLVDMDSGRLVESVGTYNRQAAYGSDVISRIIHADENAEGMKQLQDATIGTINELINELLRKHKLADGDIAAIVCAGNTVMSHLLLGLPATYLRLEPYVPCAAAYPGIRAGELGLAANPDAPVVIIPSVASYVGGDITSGVLAAEITRSEKLTLFIDIGTNGELVLGNNEWLVTCSCSAGPAFEGSGISCGMRAMDGAIDRIEIDRESLGVKYTAIGAKKPMGICGSGLINALSELMEAGIMDRSGKMNLERASSRLRKNEGEAEFVLATADESGSGRDITITESDVKNLLRAKAAIFAGIRTMLQLVQLEVDAVDRVYIAGGFGNYINITDAISIGLLPDLELGKYQYVGNSSIQGAMAVLLSRGALEEAEKLANMMTYLELSVGNLFMDEFVSALFLPHTDLGLFKSVTGNC